MRYFLHLSFQGKKFHGWQNQKKYVSVQEVLEKNLSSLLKTPTHIHGCGRTDAGVSASQYFAHLDIEEEIDYDFVFRINKLLPTSIVVYDLIPVEKNANAQLDASRRTYDFFSHFEESPFLHDVSTFYNEPNLDFQKIKKAVNLLLGKNEFGAFCKSVDLYQGFTDCEIYEVNLLVNDSQTRMQFQITADRFLRGMIRILQANLIRVGSGKMSLDEFEHCLKSGENPGHHEVAKPQGLYLSKIEYPYLNIEPKEHFLSF